MYKLIQTKRWWRRWKMYKLIQIQRWWRRCKMSTKLIQTRWWRRFKMSPFWGVPKRRREPGNAEKVQIFPTASLVSLFYQYVRSLLFILIKGLVLINRRSGPRDQHVLVLCAFFFLNRGNTERTNSSKILCLMFVCVRFVSCHNWFSRFERICVLMTWVRNK